MVYIFLGSMAFILFFLFDYYNMRNFNFQKHITGIAAIGIFIYSSVMSITQSEAIEFPMVIQLASTVLFIIAAALLIYSLFLELPFKATYADNNYNSFLVSTGTYALCRHPGVLWLFFSLTFLFFMTGSVIIGFAALVWTSIDILYVYLQERVFFCKMFLGYNVYQMTTPMLLPNKRSISKCVRSFSINEQNISAVKTVIKR